MGRARARAHARALRQLVSEEGPTHLLALLAVGVHEAHRHLEREDQGARGDGRADDLFFVLVWFVRGA